jgi:hypothetical protein
MSFQPCSHCGTYHTVPCPRIKAIEYHQDGTMKRVEYHPHLGMQLLVGMGNPAPSAAQSTAPSMSVASGQTNNCEQDEGA